jgi:hypothetical protein
MKKLIAFVSLAAFQVSPLMAHVGGPWSTNTYDNNISGIFGGMITMKNGSGIFRFSQTETAQLSAFSASMVYFQGVTFLGSCQANIDWPSKKIFGMTNGSAYNRSPRAATQQTPPINDNNPNWEPQSPGARIQTITLQLTPVVGADGTITPRPFTFTNPGFSGPVGIANTHWQGKLTSTAPSVRFEAKGQAAFIGAQPQIFRPTILESPPTVVPVPGVGSVTIPGKIEEISIDYGGNDPFPKPTNQQKIRVFGSRITYNPNPSVGGLNLGVDGTGGGAFAF